MAYQKAGERCNRPCLRQFHRRNMPTARTSRLTTGYKFNQSSRTRHLWCHSRRTSPDRAITNWPTRDCRRRSERLLPRVAVNPRSNIHFQHLRRVLAKSCTRGPYARPCSRPLKTGISWRREILFSDQPSGRVGTKT